MVLIERIMRDQPVCDEDWRKAKLDRIDAGTPKFASYGPDGYVSCDSREWQSVVLSKREVERLGQA